MAAAEDVFMLTILNRELDLSSCISWPLELCVQILFSPNNVITARTLVSLFAYEPMRIVKLASFSACA
jgi:hypothetical protein